MICTIPLQNKVFLTLTPESPRTKKLLIQTAEITFVSRFENRDRCLTEGLLLQGNPGFDISIDRHKGGVSCPTFTVKEMKLFQEAMNVKSPEELIGKEVQIVILDWALKPIVALLPPEIEMDDEISEFILSNAGWNYTHFDTIYT